MTKMGTIVGFETNRRSGLATVFFEHGECAFVESGFGLRQFTAAFGRLRGAVGQPIQYEIDELGILTDFTPVIAYGEEVA